MLTLVQRSSVYPTGFLQRRLFEISPSSLHLAVCGAVSLYDREFEESLSHGWAFRLFPQSRFSGITLCLTSSCTHFGPSGRIPERGVSRLRSVRGKHGYGGYWISREVFYSVRGCRGDTSCPTSATCPSWSSTVSAS